VKFTSLVVDTRDELLACILDAAAHIKKREDQLKRTTFSHTICNVHWR